MQAGGITREFIRTLALTQGVTLPENRLDAVLKQYQSFLQSLARMLWMPDNQNALVRVSNLRKVLQSHSQRATSVFVHP